MVEFGCPSTVDVGTTVIWVSDANCWFGHFDHSTSEAGRHLGPLEVDSSFFYTIVYLTDAG